MMPWLAWFAVALAVGSIPFGLIIARTKGIDIRAHGSGNIGATNVARVLGPRLGLLCFILDIAKGLLPTLGYALGENLLGTYALSQTQAWAWTAIWIAPILGHMFSPFLRFRGGKGVATALGSMLGVFPVLTIPVLAAILVFALVLWKWRLVGIASCAAALVIPAGVLVSLALIDTPKSGIPFLIVTSALSILVIFKHRANISRTLAGTEPRFGSDSSGSGSELPPRDQ